MTKIKQFDRDTLRDLRTELEETLVTLGNDFGIVFKIGNMRFSATTAKATLDIVLADGADSGKSVEELTFLKMASQIGLDPSDLGKTIKLNSKSFTISGYNSRATVNKMQVRDSVTGKVFITDVATVQRALGKPVSTFMPQRGRRRRSRFED